MGLGVHARRQSLELTERAESDALHAQPSASCRHTLKCMGVPPPPPGVTLSWRPDAAGTDAAFTELSWCDPSVGEVLVADSFRVVGGRARGIEHHLARFLSGAAALRDRGAEVRSAGSATVDIEAFVADARAAIAASSHAHPSTAVFPRIELRERGDARLLMRPSPPLSSSAVLATASHDPRRVPTVKGPDLERLASLRTAAQALGADEAVILDARGRVIEGAYSALLWSRGGRLYAVGTDAARIPSVTERIVGDALRASGDELASAHPTLDELSGAAIWVLSALHGARAVAAWVDGPPVARDPDRDAWLRDALAQALAPV